MSNFPDLPGRDILPGDSLASSDLTTPRHLKTVVISLMKEGGDVEYAVAPLRSSYSAAVITAFEVLGDHLGDLTPNIICLKMGAKDLDGKPIWASIAPSLWNEIISEHTTLRIFPKFASASAIPMQSAKISGNKYEDRPIITLEIPGSAAKEGKSLYMFIIVPNSYDEARTLAFNLLKNRFKATKESPQNIILRAFIEGTRENPASFEAYISAYGTSESSEWVHLITQLKKEHPSFKILMY